jgi:hypothetical protein
VNVENKEQSKQWINTHSPNKPKVFKQISTRKLMTIVFGDRKGVLMVEFMQQGTRVSGVCIMKYSEQKAWNADFRCNAPP